jgi:hypothetical protein
VVVGVGGGEQPAEPDANFADFLDSVEVVLDTVLERFETRYYQVFHRLDMLLERTNPTNADATTTASSTNASPTSKPNSPTSLADQPPS